MAIWVFTLALPAAGQASIVTVRHHPEQVYGQEVVYIADPGEYNDVALREVPFSFEARESWEVHDSGAVVTAGAQCSSIDAHTARCNAGVFLGSPIGGYRAFLGDQEDKLAVTSTTSSSDVGWVVVDGGAGNDVLFGGETDVLGDRLFGGGGRDELHGEGGPDLLSDGDRSDEDGDLAPRRDLLDGGSGTDMVSYRQRRAAVLVDLEDPDAAGEAGEGDRLIDIESLRGGRGRDRLLGDDGPNSLDGRAGRDRLIGRGGDDRIVFGGSISCGAGDDTVAEGTKFYGNSTPLGFLRPDCETIDPWHSGDSLSPYPQKATDTSIAYRIRCPVDIYDESLPCSGNLAARTIARPPRLLARGSFPRGDWEQRLLRARLTALGRALAARRRGVRAKMRFAGRGFPPPAEWTIRLAIDR